MDYSLLENDFDCACQDVIKSLSDQYRSEYEPGGPGRLEAFFGLIKKEFEIVENSFIERNSISDDKEALRRIRAIAKLYAKRCVDDYGKIKISQ